MASFTGGQLAARMLKAEGVKHLFTLPGLHLAPICAGCAEEDIPAVDTRHERAAAHAADAMAPLTEALGGYGELVSEPAGTRPAPERAIASNTVACVCVMIDPEAPERSGMLGHAV